LLLLAIAQVYAVTYTVILFGDAFSLQPRRTSRPLG
jgi:hypothetical protein